MGYISYNLWVISHTTYGLYLIQRRKKPTQGRGVTVIFGRIAGWTFVVLAIVMASAEAVMALGTGAYNGLATVDVWTLLVGQTPSFTASSSGSPQVLAGVGSVVMAMPAWVVFVTMGFAFIHLCRKRRARRRVFHHSY